MMRAVLRGLDRVIRAIIATGEVLSALALVAGVLLNVWNILGRYLFHAPVPWAEEVMLYLMLALVFLGAGVVSLRGRHIRMDIALHLFPPRLRPAFDLLSELMFLVVGCTVIWLGVPVIMQFADFDQRSEAADIPVWIPHSVIPLGMALMLLATLARITERLLHQAPPSSTLDELARANLADSSQEISR
jgi:TRAP-type C4-dicarboxylate transport system permease small subunit